MSKEESREESEEPSEEMSHDPSEGEVESGSYSDASYHSDGEDDGSGEWLRGRHDQLAKGFSHFPYSKAFVLYLGNVLRNGCEDEEDGPAWFVEKNTVRAVGGLGTNDVNFLARHAEEDFRAIMQASKKQAPKSFPEYDSDAELESEKVCTDRALRKIWSRTRKAESVKVILKGHSYESDREIGDLSDESESSEGESEY